MLFMENIVTEALKRPREVLQSICGNYLNWYKPYYPWDVGKEEKIYKNKSLMVQQSS